MNLKEVKIPAYCLTGFCGFSKAERVGVICPLATENGSVSVTSSVNLNVVLTGEKIHDT